MATAEYKQGGAADLAGIFHTDTEPGTHDKPVGSRYWELHQEQEDSSEAENSEGVIFEVRHEGESINEEQLASEFEPYKQYRQEISLWLEHNESVEERAVDEYQRFLGRLIKMQVNSWAMDDIQSFHEYSKALSARSVKKSPEEHGELSTNISFKNDSNDSPVSDGIQLNLHTLNFMYKSLMLIGIAFVLLAAIFMSAVFQTYDVSVLLVSISVFLYWAYKRGLKPIHV